MPAQPSPQPQPSPAGPRPAAAPPSLADRAVGALVALCPLAVLAVFGALADAPWRGVFGVDALRGWGPARWAWLGLGVLLVVSPSLRAGAIRALAGVAARWRRMPGGLRRGLSLMAWAGLFVGWRCQNFFLGDSFQLTHTVGRLLYVHWSEPLDILLHAGGYSVLHAVTGATTAELSYVALSTLAGLAYVQLPPLIARDLGLDEHGRRLLVGLMWTVGAMQLFFGYVESYTLCSLGLTAYMALALRVLRPGWSQPTGASTSERDPGARQRRLLRWTGLTAGVTVCLHPLTLSAMPSLLVVAWAAPALLPGRSAGAHLEVTVATRAWSVVRTLAWTALPVALLIAGVHLSGHGLDRFGHTDVPGGGDGRMLVPLLEATTRFERKTLLSWLHWRDVLNELTLIAPLGLVALLVGGVAGALRGFRWDARLSFLAVATAGMAVFVTLWNPDLGAARDWDLYAPAAFPLTLFGALLLCRTLRPDEVETASVTWPLTALLVTAPWVWANSHRRVPRVRGLGG